MFGFKITAFRDPFSGEVELRAANIGSQFNEVFGEMRIIQQEKEKAVEPFLKISGQAAQSLMNQLFECGIRPNGDFGTPGHLKALENHVSDLRKIAFKKLGVE